jgi:hypothetical protein
MNEHITDKDYYPLPEDRDMKEVIHGDTKTVTRTVYAVAWETESGLILESVWCHEPLPGAGTAVLSKIEISYESPVDLEFVRADKSDRIAMLRAELAKLGVAA